jgi:hypothetical protein
MWLLWSFVIERRRPTDISVRGNGALEPAAKLVDLCADALDDLLGLPAFPPDGRLAGSEHLPDRDADDETERGN